MTPYPLPVSPSDPAFGAYCQRRQLEYIARERWRYGRALEVAGGHLPDKAPAWAALLLHPMTVTECQDRLNQLDSMEADALEMAGDGGTLSLAAALANSPSERVPP